MWLTGDPDRAPRAHLSAQLCRHASAEAAVHSLVALHHAQTGVGQHVDVSAQLAGVRTLMNAPAFHLLEGRDLSGRPAAPRATTPGSARSSPAPTAT